MTSPLTVLVGAGEGLGQALATRFAQGGHRLVLLSRTPEGRELAMQQAQAVGVEVVGINCDVSQEESVAQAFAQIREEVGDPTVLLYNAGVLVQGSVLSLTPETFEQTWKINCMGSFLCAREVLPAMEKAQQGTLIFSGATAALRGGAHFSAMAVSKFGLRALSQSIAREFGPQGIHSVHVILDGLIETPTVRTKFPKRPLERNLQPEDIAEQYWNLYQQSPSTWTQELDLRPFNESF